MVNPVLHRSDPLPNPTVFSFGELVSAGVAAALLVGASFVASPWLVLGGLVAVVGASRFWRSPIPALLLILIFYSTIFEVDVLPLVPIGIGSLNPIDVVLLSCLAMIAFRRWREPDFTFFIGLPEFAVLIFVTALALSTVVGLTEGLTNIDDATNEIRYSGYYLVILVVGALSTSIRDVDRLINCFLGLAVLVALLMIIQAAVGDAITLVNGRVEPIGQGEADPDGATRVIPGGRYLILVAFWTFSTLLGMAREHVWKYRIGWLVTGAGVLLTFNRNFWVSSVVVLSLIAIALGRGHRRHFGRGLLGATGIATALCLAVLVGPSNEVKTSLIGFGDRTLSIFDSETYESTSTTPNGSLSSLEFRRAENRYAAPHLTPPSPLGLGAGAPYRPLDPRLDWDEFIDGPAYIHNGHFWVLIKAGYIGYGALMVAFLSSIARGLNLWRRLEDPKHQAVCIVFSLGLVGVLLSSIVDPALTDATWAPIFGVITGVNAAFLRLHQGGTRHSVEQGIAQASSRRTTRPIPVGAR